MRRLGFASFKDLKDVIATKNRISPAYKMAQSVHHPTERYSQLFTNEIEHLNETMKHLDVSQFTQALEMLHQVGTLHIFGKGAAFGLAHLLYFRFNRFKKNTRLMEASGSSLLESLNLVKANDDVVLFAFDQMPIEAQLILEHQKKVGFTTLVITDRLYNNQTLEGHNQLYVARGDKDTYHSMVTPMAMIDTLVVEYAKMYPDETIDAFDAFDAFDALYNLYIIPRFKKINGFLHDFFQYFLINI